MELSQTRRGPGAPIPPTFVYVAGFVLGWWLNSAHLLPIDNRGPGILQLFLGWFSILIGGGLFLWGLGAFARARTGIMLQHPAARVVRAGPYQWSRNPQYVGFTFGYIGVAWLANLAWPLAVLPIVVMIVDLGVIAREERYMRATFGRSYEDYCREVRRWL